MTTPLSNIRNLAFVGHPSAGKTTLVDAMAFAVGASPRKGSVAEKTSICDTEPEEHEKGHTLQLAAVSALWKGKTWTFLDTPGYPEFVAETGGALFAADLVVGVVSCASAVSYNLRKKMEAARELGRPRAIVVTHLDGENADYDKTVDAIRAAIGNSAVPFLLPDHSGPAFSAVRRTLQDPESPWRQALLDQVMDACEDENLLNRYLETQELDDEALKALVPAALAKGSLVPILVCNPDRGTGVAEVLEFFDQFAPGVGAASFRDAAGAAIAPDAAGEMLAIVFNVKTDPHVGKVCLARVLRGAITATSHVGGPRSAEKGEKLGGLFRLVGKKREPIDTAGPGDIVAFSKVETIALYEPVTTAGKKVPGVLVPTTPVPMVSIAIQPKSRADEQKIGEALHKIEAEDPTFKIDHIAETHEMVMRGMSDLHLQVIEARLKRRFGVEITTHTPRIAYRETITKSAEGHHRHKKQSGGRGQFGECFLRVRPKPQGTGFVFTDAVVGGSIPRNLIPAVEKGIREILPTGVMTHSQVVDMEVELYDGKFHDVDSDEASFKIAGARAFRDGFTKANPVLLEPVMEVEVHAPTHAAGTIFSDITSHRRGHVIDQGNEADGSVTIIKATVPLSTVQTYHRDLKSQTAGEGSYTMKLSHYAQVPLVEQQKVLAQFGKKHADED